MTADRRSEPVVSNATKRRRRRQILEQAHNLKKIAENTPISQPQEQNPPVTLPLATPTTGPASPPLLPTPSASTMAPSFYAPAPKKLTRRPLPKPSLPSVSPMITLKRGRSPSPAEAEGSIQTLVPSKDLSDQLKTPPDSPDRPRVTKNSEELSKKDDALKDFTSSATRTDEGCCPELEKFYYQRYRYFHKFDQGIGLDQEGWYSVTPELIAKHQAQKVAGRMVVDLFTGCGGNAIQFALQGCKVLAIDIDENRLKLARQNASVYGVENNIQFIHGDALEIFEKLKDVVLFLSPPWGGPEYLNKDKFYLDNMVISGVKGKELLRRCLAVSKDVIAFLPRNTPYSEIAAVSPRGSIVEVEENYLNSKIKAITVYFSEVKPAC